MSWHRFWAFGYWLKLFHVKCISPNDSSSSSSSSTSSRVSGVGGVSGLSAGGVVGGRSNERSPLPRVDVKMYEDCDLMNRSSVDSDIPGGGGYNPLYNNPGCTTGGIHTQMQGTGGATGQCYTADETSYENCKVVQAFYSWIKQEKNMNKNCFY